MKSVRIKHALGKTAGLKQREAQKDRITDTSPYGARYIACNRNVLNQRRIDRNANHDQEGLEPQCKQAAQIVLTHLPPFTVHHACHRDRSDRRDHIDLNHAPVDNNHPLLTRDMNPFVDANLEKLLTHLGKISKNVCNLLTSREGG